VNTPDRGGEPVSPETQKPPRFPRLQSLAIQLWLGLVLLLFFWIRILGSRTLETLSGHR